jgi:maleylacetoacetate isomerase
MAEHLRFELFAFWRTSATFRVRVALNLKGLTAHERIVDLDAGEQRSESFLKVNPLGAIPALVEAGYPPLTQSLAILEFLDEIAPNPPLLPADPHGRARVRSIAAMLAADTHPLITPRVKRYLTTKGGFDDAAWRAWQIEWFTTGLRALEQRLDAEVQTGAYCHGDSVTTADICLASILAVMRVFNVSVSGIPTIDRIVALCDKHEAFAKADPLKQKGAPEKARKA